MPSTWRKVPFTKGRSYRVRKSFKALRAVFQEGEILRYDNDAYSLYDACTGFFFFDSEGKIRSWDVRDDQSIDVWPELFELDEKPA